MPFYHYVELLVFEARQQLIQDLATLRQNIHAAAVKQQPVEYPQHQTTPQPFYFKSLAFSLGFKGLAQPFFLNQQVICLIMFLALIGLACSQLRTTTGKIGNRLVVIRF